jgi:hypothetical protein
MSQANPARRPWAGFLFGGYRVAAFLVSTTRT